MENNPSEKIIKMLRSAFTYEERLLFEFQYRCYQKLPGSLNKKELEGTRIILDVLMVQTMNHANIISDLIAKFYERTSKKL